MLASTVQRSGVSQLVAVLGQGLVSRFEGFITADDYGVTRGDGCFDATAVLRGPKGAVVLDRDAHLDRLANSAAALEIRMPGRSRWIAAIGNVLAAWRGERAALKLVLTRGLEHAKAGPTAFVTLTEMLPGEAKPIKGMRVVTLSRGTPSDAYTDAPWLLGGVKTLSYAVPQAAKRHAETRGAQDVLFTSTDGYCLEGPTSALLWKKGTMIGSTPTGATGILPSITVAKIFRQAAAAHVTVGTSLIRPDELDGCDGAWLVSSVRGVAPISQLDDRDLPMDARFSRQLHEWVGF